MALFFSKRKQKGSVADGNKEILIAQAERISELKKENHALSVQLNKLRENEQQALEVLHMAREKAKDYEKEAKIRFSLECERLEIYRSRWQGYIRSLESAKELGKMVIETEKKLRDCERELKKIIMEDLPYDCPAAIDYSSESERLEEIAPLPLADAESLSDDDLRKLVLQLLDKD